MLQSLYVIAEGIHACNIDMLMASMLFLMHIITMMGWRLNSFRLIVVISFVRVNTDDGLMRENIIRDEMWLESLWSI